VGYFAQVKRGLFRSWKTIGKHMNGFGEHDEDHLDFPLPDQQQAVLMAHAHAEYIGAKKGFTSYTDLAL